MVAAASEVLRDAAGIARGLARLLRRDGHHVETASNGRQALAMLQEQDYDLVLCDLRMPDLDGPGLYRTWQSVSRICSPVLSFSPAIP
jgi:CheY-like chemotaxis protein